MKSLSGRSLILLACLVASPCDCFGQYGNVFQSAPQQSVYQGRTYSQPAIQQRYSHSIQPQQAYSRPSYSRPSYSGSYSNRGYRNSSMTNGRQVLNYGNQGYSTSHTNRGYHSTQRRSNGTNLQNLKNATPGRYYRWKTASGTSDKGYVAHDGSRWKLLKSSGIVEVDRWGNQRTVSHQSSGHPHRYVWQIQRSSSSRKTAWITRNQTTGSVSVFYQRPRYSAQTQFYPATVVLEDNTRIVDLQWQRTPDWASDTKLVVNSKYPKLPVGIHRSTTKKYLPASEYDVTVAQRALQSTRRPQTVLELRPYEEAPAPTTVGRPSLKMPSIALPQSYQNYATPGTTVAR